MKKVLVVAAALLAGAVTFAPNAEAGNGRTGAFIGGVAAGVVGSALLGAVTAPPVYAAPPAYYAAPAPGPVYVQPGYEEVVPACVIHRVPLYDSYGNFAGYQRRRVCN